MYELNESVACEISYSIPNFDMACKNVCSCFTDKFGIDEDGNINNVDGAPRGGSALNIEFKGMKISGGTIHATITYFFIGKITLCDEL